MVKIQFKEGKTFVLPNESKDGYYYDGLLAKRLDRYKKAIIKNWDFVFVIDGAERAGKSIFAQQIAQYLTNGNFTIDKLTFTADDFIKTATASKKGDCVIWDEAFRGLAGRSTMSDVNKLITGFLMECGQKNLYIILVLPSFWDLDRYALLHRCRGVFHIHTDANLNRGFFKFYTRDSVRFMLVNHRKFRYGYCMNCLFRGRFINWYGLPE